MTSGGMLLTYASSFAPCIYPPILSTRNVSGHRIFTAHFWQNHTDREDWQG